LARRALTRDHLGVFTTVAVLVHLLGWPVSGELAGRGGGLLTLVPNSFPSESLRLWASSSSSSSALVLAFSSSLRSGRGGDVAACLSSVATVVIGRRKIG